MGTISIELTATDTAGATADDTFDITVNNINDAPIVLDQGFSVDPDDPVGTVVGTISASDPDGDNLTFAIVSGNDDGTFALDSDTGEITIANTAGLVEDTTIVLDVEVTDDGVPVLMVTAQVSINVLGNLPPDAVDDPDFVTQDDTILMIDVSELLANDTDPDNDTLVVAQVNPTSQRGASIQLSGNNINYNPATSAELLALHDGEQLVDTFQYTVSDGNGGTDTATVTVTVNGVDVVEFILRTTDSSGNEISDIPTGQSFELRVFVQDVRDVATGVFSAFVDVTFPDSLVSTIGDVIHSSTYNSATFSSLDMLGMLDEVGGVDGISPLGGAEFELFRIEFQAGAAPGNVAFASDRAGDTNPGDAAQHVVLPFGASAALDPLQILFGTTSIDVVGPAAAMSARASVETNVANPMDVNGDFVVSPLDALLIINRLGGDAQSSNLLADVNSDGATTPLDALLVINQLSGATPRAAMSAHASLADFAGNSAIFPAAVESPLPTKIAQSVDVVFADLDNAIASSEIELVAVSHGDLFDRWSLPDQSATDNTAVDLADWDDDLFGNF